MSWMDGYLLKTFKMSLILPEVVLVKFIQQIGLMNIFFWDIENQKWYRDSDLKMTLKGLENSSDISNNITYLKCIYINIIVIMINNNLPRFADVDIDVDRILSIKNNQ